MGGGRQLLGRCPSIKGTSGVGTELPCRTLPAGRPDSERSKPAAGLPASKGQRRVGVDKAK
eukprot:3103395-Alexandrium_andersonii.AAC.1